MDITDVLTDPFRRIRDLVHQVLDGATPDQLLWRPGPDANTAAWLLWHLTRVQDDHVAAAAATEQAWTADGWVERFGLPFPASETGYGQSSDEVGQVRPAADLLAGYHDAVCDRTLAYVANLEGPDLDRVVDERWDPPVTLGVRLVSVVEDDLQHVGQAAYVKGLAERAG